MQSEQLDRGYESRIPRDTLSISARIFLPSRHETINIVDKEQRHLTVHGTNGDVLMTPKHQIDTIKFAVVSFPLQGLKPLPILSPALIKVYALSLRQTTLGTIRQSYLYCLASDRRNTMFL